ncbi:MAG: GFA family protein [Rhizobiaceae bacterium]|nr:GFA family protein [Rhizobiaceae bacterium]
MDGRCTCGTIRYRLKDRPLFVHCCHCRWCQRETGSAFVMNALIEAECVEVTGTPDVIDTPSESGKGQRISRCPTCKVAVWSTYSGAGPKFMFVRVGTLDDPDACPPDIHIFTESKQPWVVIPEGVPVMKQFYRRSEQWPAWAIARAKAAAER